MVTYNVNLEGKTVLVTGAAGFIGSNLVKRLFKDIHDIKVIGIDSITDYYDVNIKYGRLKEIEALGCDWQFYQASIADRTSLENIFTEHKISVVVNLAAQAGVRYSITNPDAYIESNLIGFYNILEACVIMRWSIWYMLLRVRFMARTRKYHILLTIRWTIRCRFMRPRRRVMN